VKKKNSGRELKLYKGADQTRKPPAFEQQRREIRQVLIILTAAAPGSQPP